MQNVFERNFSIQWLFICRHAIRRNLAERYRFRKNFRISIVMGLIRSLVGPNPLHDHHGPHLINAGELKGPDTHQDSGTDFRENYFAIQLSFFFEATPNDSKYSPES